MQLTFESAANRIVTHNVRHLAPAVRVGIEVLNPGQSPGHIDSDVT